MVNKRLFSESAVIVEPSKETKQGAVFLLAVLFLFSIFLLLVPYTEPSTVLTQEERVKNAVIAALISYLVFIPIAFFEFVLLKHYVVFDKDGVWVCFLKYKKFHSWSEFEVKQIINKRNSNMHMLWQGVMFVSSYEKYKRFLNQPLRRNPFFWKEPIFITFELNLKWWQRPRNVPIYEVNKEQFVSGLEKLGVELKESYSLFYEG